MPNIEYLIDSSNKISYYVSDGEKVDSIIYTIMVKSESTLESLPDEITPGSIAYTAGVKSAWQKDFDGEWISIK